MLVTANKSTSALGVRWFDEDEGYAFDVDSHPMQVMRSLMLSEPVGLSFQATKRMSKCFFRFLFLFFCVLCRRGMKPRPAGFRLCDDSGCGVRRLCVFLLFGLSSMVFEFSSFFP